MKNSALQLWLAVFVTVCGVALIFATLLIPPPGHIDPTVLTAYRETLTFAYSPKFKRMMPLLNGVPKTSTQPTQPGQVPTPGTCRQGAEWAPLQASVADDCVISVRQEMPPSEESGIVGVFHSHRAIDIPSGGRGQSVLSVSQSQA